MKPNAVRNQDSSERQTESDDDPLPLVADCRDCWQTYLFCASEILDEHPHATSAGHTMAYEAVGDRLRRLGIDPGRGVATDGGEPSEARRSSSELCSDGGEPVLVALLRDVDGIGATTARTIAEEFDDREDLRDVVEDIPPGYSPSRLSKLDGFGPTKARTMAKRIDRSGVLDVATDGGHDLELEPTTEVRDLNGHWHSDGSLYAVECTSKFWLAGEDEHGNYVRQEEERAKLRYSVDDNGVARLDRVVDNYTSGLSDEPKQGIAPSLLRTLAAAEDAIEKLPGVDRVEEASQTLGRPIDVDVMVVGDDDV